MINKDLLNFDFYKNSLSLFLKQSYGIVERDKILFDILKNVDLSIEKTFNYLDIFYYKSDSDNYISKNSVSGKTLIWLDFIGYFLGISRKFYIEETLIELNDLEFLTYIEAIIEKFNFDGTYENVWKVYNGYPANEEVVRTSFLLKLNIIFTTDQTNKAVCNVYMNKTGSANLDFLFEKGLLTPQSLGIHYTYTLKE